MNPSDITTRSVGSTHSGNPYSRTAHEDQDPLAQSRQQVSILNKRCANLFQENHRLQGYLREAIQSASQSAREAATLRGLLALIGTECETLSAGAKDDKSGSSQFSASLLTALGQENSPIKSAFSKSFDTGVAHSKWASGLERLSQEDG